MAYEFERGSYRIPYPPSARPRFASEGVEYAVVDCSERGLRYECPSKAPAKGTRIEGSVRLVSAGPAHPVVGVVVRLHEGTVALELERPGIPVGAIFAEQRYLARRFPARYGSSTAS